MPVKPYKEVVESVETARKKIEAVCKQHNVHVFVSGKKNPKYYVTSNDKANQFPNETPHGVCVEVKMD